ncbi:low molecular weight protein-tyrosine-phosphatase [Metabacillus indicus]|uniref:low molecular weight protein-tyrosine-phosphatase n=1 Tax=Metabacillus indicus TaxID=246786 RepID=UPI003CF98781
MIKVVFVCLGNICRSPMAEGIMRHLIEEEGLSGLISADSAGTGNWHIGKGPHEGTRRMLEENQISFEGITARQVSMGDLTESDYIIAMDNENLGFLRRLAGYSKTGYVGRLMDFVPDSDIADVPDPYYTDNFEEVYDMVYNGCRLLLNRIVEDHHLKEAGDIDE